MQSQPSAILAAGKSNAYAKSTEAAAIEERRRRYGLSAAALCREAAIAQTTYWRIVCTGATPQRRILVKLARALDQLIARRPAQGGDVIAAMLRAAYVAAAAAFDLDPASVEAPRSSCNFGIHADIGRLRQLAFYLVVTALDVPRPLAARAAGYSKQAAAKAIASVEQRREAADYEAKVVALGRLITGKDLT